jgi:hypothetical protein
LNSPVSVVAPNDKDRKLTEPFEHTWTHDGVQYRVVVPEGYTYRPTTTALPRSAITLIWGRYALEDESCVHDYTWDDDCIYWADGKRVEEGRMPKGASDALFFENDGKPVLRWVAWLMSMTIGWPLWWDWHEILSHK